MARKILVTIASLHRDKPDRKGYHYSLIGDIAGEDNETVLKLLRQVKEAGLVKIAGPNTDYALTESGWGKVQKIEKDDD